MHSFLRETWQVLKATVKKWSDDDAPTHAAALSYYAIFSVAPILVVAIAIAVPILGQQKAEHGVLTQAGQWMGGSDTHLFRTAVEGAHRPAANFLMGIVGVGALLFGSNGIFLQLYKSLNRIWKTPSAEVSGVWNSLKQRGKALLMVLVIGFLFLASMLIGIGLAASKSYGAPVVGGAIWQNFAAVAETVTSLAIFTLLFGLVFKILPEVDLEWRDVLPGAFVSAILFDVGKVAIGAYLGKSNIGSSFGAAGSMALFLLWVFYGAMIVLFGAEFTYVDSTRRRKRRGEAAPSRKKRR